MAALMPSSSSHHRHEPLPSLPPSPSTEEDLAAMRSLNGDTTDNDLLVPGSAKYKGKGKARERPDSDQELDEPFTPPDDADFNFDDASAVASYPPTNEEEEESRRIEENLRRWEQAERQRRRAARESTAASVSSSTSAGGASRSSIVGDVARKTTQLWQNRRSSRHSSGGSNAHRVLSTRESLDTDVPLEDIHGEAEHERAQSPTTPTQSSQTLFAPTPLPRDNLSPSSPYDNPFEPPDSGTPFGDPKYSAIMDASSPPLTPFPPSATSSRTLVDRSTFAPDRPVLQASSSHGPGKMPPPRPLDLPPPRTPPPRIDTPGVITPPGPIASPSPGTRVGNTDNANDPPEKEKRWWTDWLCGCSEGPDRGGDNQAGRTNPFE